MLRVWKRASWHWSLQWSHLSVSSLSFPCFFKLDPSHQHFNMFKLIPLQRNPPYGGWAISIQVPPYFSPYLYSPASWKRYFLLLSLLPFVQTTHFLSLILPHSLAYQWHRCCQIEWSLILLTSLQHFALWASFIAVLPAHSLSPWWAPLPLPTPQRLLFPVFSVLTLFYSQCTQSLWERLSIPMIKTTICILLIQPRCLSWTLHLCLPLIEYTHVDVPPIPSTQIVQIWNNEHSSPNYNFYVFYLSK